MSTMIAGSTERAAQLAARLARRARRLAMAHAEDRFRAQRGDEGRWRKPALLWPLAGKED